jgi:hypothetical protein
LLTYSEQFDNAAWSVISATVSANTAVAPDGTLTADKLVAQTSFAIYGAFYGGQIIRTSAANGSGIHTWSVYAKAGECGLINIIANVTGFAKEVLFNLTNGTFSIVSGNTSNTAVRMEAVGNGWYRCSVTPTDMGAYSGNLLTNIQVFNTVSTPSTGYSGVYIWGAQLEAGSFATSYIPTVASQVTRVADSASMTGTNFSSWYRADEGTVYVEQIPTNTATTNQSGLSLFESSVSYTAIGHGTGGGLTNSAFYVIKNSADQAFLSRDPVVSANSPLKSAGAYKTNDFAFSVNGNAILTDASGQLINPTELRIGRSSISTPNYANGAIRKIAYYPLRLTNAELVGLSTI